MVPLLLKRTIVFFAVAAISVAEVSAVGLAAIGSAIGSAIAVPAVPAVAAAGGVVFVDLNSKVCVCESALYGRTIRCNKVVCMLFVII